MNRLHTLRNAPWLARLALLWFVLTLGAAVASPMVQPQHGLVICTGAGMLKVRAGGRRHGDHRGHVRHR